MRILYVVHTYPPDSWGGTELHVRGLARCLAKDHDVRIFCRSGDEDAIIFFAMKTDGDVIYELLNEDLSLRRAVTVEDFHRDWQRHWPGEQD